MDFRLQYASLRKLIYAQKKSQIIVVRGILINSKGEVFLVPRKTKDNRLIRYELPGGKLEFGEVPQEALIREFLEETGLKIQVLRPYHIFSAVARSKDGHKRQMVEITFKVKLADKHKDVREINTFDNLWVSKEDLNSLSTTIETKERVEQVLS